MSDLFGSSFSGMVGRVRKVREQKDKGAIRGTKIAGEHILGVSNERVPIEDGDLERSGAVSQSSDGYVAISYDTDYAVKQHEDMSLAHDAGRQAKFLESAIMSERDIALQILAAAVKKELGL